MTAARKHPTSDDRDVQVALRAAKRPAVNSSESPGRKKPNSSPDSAKMISDQPDRPEGPDELLGIDHVRDAGEDHRDRLDGRFCDPRAGPV